MGCDIHMFIEYRNTGCPWQADEHHFVILNTCITSKKPKGQWCEHCRNGGTKWCTYTDCRYNEVTATGRNYTLFGLLASVRREGVRKPRGIPNDCSQLIKEIHQVGYGHSPSYMPLEEFKKVLFEEYNSLAVMKNFDLTGHQYTPTDRYDIFYDWEEYRKNNKQEPPDYTSIVTYCEKLIKEKNMDKHILGEDAPSDVEVRLIFWFDS